MGGQGRRFDFLVVVQFDIANANRVPLEQFGCFVDESAIDESSIPALEVFQNKARSAFGNLGVLSRHGAAFQNDVAFGVSSHDILAVFQGIATPHRGARNCVQIWHDTNRQVFQKKQSIPRASPVVRIGFPWE